MTQLQQLGLVVECLHLELTCHVYAFIPQCLVLTYMQRALRVMLVRRETGLSHPVKCLTDRSKAALLLWIIYVISVLFLLCFCARLYSGASLSPAGKGMTAWLSFVMPNCEVVTFLLVTWVRCGA